MTRALLTLFAAAGLLAGSPAHAEEMQVSDLRIDWLEGYRTTSSGSSPLRLIGPGGETMLISLMGTRPGMSDEARSALRERVRASSESVLVAQAEKAGKIALPLERTVLPDGSSLSAVGAETNRLFTKGFFLEFLIASPAGRFAFITLEGKGNLAEQCARALPRFQTVKWADRPAAQSESAASTPVPAAVP